MEELASRWSGRIIFLASEKCQEVLSDELRKRAEVVTIDDRNERELSRFFANHKHTLAVVNLNKPAIKAAKAVGVRSIFVDSLAWMWKSVPDEYLRAGTYYYYDLFGARQKLSGIKNAKPIPPVLGRLPAAQGARSRDTVVHIGGLSNPFGLGIPESYLRLIADALSGLQGTNRVIIAGGTQAIDYLRKLGLPDSRFVFGTFGREEFLQAVSSTGRLVTTSGSMATLEAFAMGAPTAFLPPTNLSQWKQLRLLQQAGAAPLCLEWESVAAVRPDLENLSEEDAMKEFRLIADGVYQDAKLRADACAQTKLLFSSEFDSSGQQAFIQKAGRDGAAIIVSDMLKLLNSRGS